MTEETRETTEGQHETERAVDGQTMKQVSHTNPNTGETFGTVYRRGPAVADGGSTDARGGGADPATEADEADERDPMREVDHTPRDGDGANEVWERGEEQGRDEHAGDVDE
jgi:hypothetical protein